MNRAALAAAVVLGGCRGDDGVPAVDAIDGGEVCGAPIAAPSWLDGYLASTIGQLAGVPDRATAARRATARTFLRGELDALGVTATLDDYGDGANVVGRLAATTASADWIVVGAHFDSVSDSPGANDNATGTAAVLAVARGLAALPCRDRGVMFVLFDQEEIGLVGSTVFAGRQFQIGTPITAVHTIDQVGWDADGDRRFEIEQPTAPLWAEYQAGAAAIGVTVVRTPSAGTDHEAFRERGFAAVGVTEEFLSGDTSPHYHTSTDTPATIAIPYTALATRLVTYVVARELGAP